MQPPPVPEHVWPCLIAARGAYRAAVSPAYDEVLHEVAQRVQERGSVGKAGMGALVVWKRLQVNTR